MGQVLCWPKIILKFKNKQSAVLELGQSQKFKNPASLPSAYGPREQLCAIGKHSFEKCGLRRFFS